MATLATATGAGAQHTPPPQTAATAPLVLQGATVIDVAQGRRLPDQIVVIVGSRIQQIAPRQITPMPANARIIDARGRYLIPGLWDMHVHIAEHADFAFPLFIANGVTGVREAGSSVPMAILNQWKQGVAAGTRVGPRFLVSGPSIFEADNGQTTITQGTGERKSHLIYVPPALARRVVDSLHASGVDFLKLYYMSRPMRLSLAREARRIGIPFGGHSRDTDGLEFSDSGATFLDHRTYSACGNFWDSTEVTLAVCQDAAQRLRRNNTWITVIGHSAFFKQFTPPANPVLMWHVAKLKRRAQRYIPHSHKMYADVRTGRALSDTNTFASTAAIRAAMTGYHASTAFSEKVVRTGLPIVMGTDITLRDDASGLTNWTRLGPSGFSVHDALLGFVLSGMSPLAALQTATLNPALALQATDSLGTVEAGKLADLVLLDADPLDDIMHTTHIRAVVVNGRYYDRAVLDQLLVQTEQEAARR